MPKNRYTFIKTEENVCILHDIQQDGVYVVPIGCLKD